MDQPAEADQIRSISLGKGVHQRAALTGRIYVRVQTVFCLQRNEFSSREVVENRVHFPLAYKESCGKFLPGPRFASVVPK